MSLRRVLALTLCYGLTSGNRSRVGANSVAEPLNRLVAGHLRGVPTAASKPSGGGDGVRALASALY